MAVKKRKRKKTNVSAKTEQFSMTYEVMLLLLFAFCVILALGNMGMTSIFGDVVNSIFFGVFGIMSYLIPFALFIGVCFFLGNKNNKKAMYRLAACIFIFMDLGMLMQFFAEGEFNNGTYMTLYEFSADTHHGGGILLGGMYEALRSAFGAAGAVILIFLILIICFVIITERSFVKAMEKNGRRVAEKTVEEGKRFREYRQERHEQREKEREERRIRESKEARAKRLLLNNKVGEEEVDLRQDIEKTSEEIRIERSSYAREDNAREEKSASKPKSENIEKRSDENEGGAYSPFAVDPTLRVKPVKHERHDMHEIVMDPDELDDEDEVEEITQEVEMNLSKSVSEEVEAHAASKNNGESKTEKTDETHKFDESEIRIKAAKKPENTSVPETASQNDTEEKEQQPTKNAKRKIAPIPEKEEKAEVEEDFSGYEIPPIDLLKVGKYTEQDSENELRKTAMKLQMTLKSFSVNVTMTDIIQGPTVTRYEMRPEPGLKVSKILGLIDDIKLAIAATDIRIEAPIPGKAAIGIEVPNKVNVTVMLRELIDTDTFKNAKSKVSFAVGKNISGETVVFDIAKMPHLLIAGATGSGKSVCINTIIMSILYKANPEDVKLIMVDPKVVELSIYNGLPHLLTPVVTDPQKAAGALKWGVAEMTRRYKEFADLKVRDMKGYNSKIKKLNEEGQLNEDGKPYKKMPQIVIIVDELADLMMVAKNEVESSIVRLTQLARAAGIHLIIATQRPSVNVITGLIKANMPSRIAFAVSSGVDSRTILDMNGAERLLGKGDMLFYPQGYNKPERVQGAFVSDDEVQDVVEYILDEVEELGASAEDITHEIEAAASQESNSQTSGSSGNSNEAPQDDRDQLFADAGRFIIEKKKASSGMLQRVFKIGFNRAARIMDSLAEAGVVSGENGTKPRTVLMTAEQFEAYLAGDSQDDIYVEEQEES